MAITINENTFTRVRTKNDPAENVVRSIRVPVVEADIRLVLQHKLVLFERVTPLVRRFTVSCEVVSSEALKLSRFALLIGVKVIDVIETSKSSWGVNEQYYTAKKLVDYVNANLRMSLFSEEVDVTESSVIVTRAILDCPTKDYTKRRNNGEIINNPVDNDSMRINTKLDIPGVPPQTDSSTKLVLVDSGLAKIVGEKTPFIPRCLDATEIAEVIFKHRSFGYSGLIDARALCINKAFAKVNSGSLELAVEMGESVETYAYLALLTTRIVKMIGSVRSGEWKKVIPKTYNLAVKRARSRAWRYGTSFQKELAVMMTKLAADAWLELRFAVRPLIYSAQDAISLYNDGLKSEVGRVRESSSMTVTSESTSTYVLDNGASTFLRVKSFVDTHLEAHAGVLINVDKSKATMRQLGFTNVGGALWELTFLSWALDYFSDTTGIFYAITPQSGIDVLAAWASTKETTIVVSQVELVDRASAKILSRTEITSVRDHYKRNPVSGPSLFEFHVDLDMFKATDLIALILGRTDHLPLRY